MRLGRRASPTPRRLDQGPHRQRGQSGHGGRGRRTSRLAPRPVRHQSRDRRQLQADARRGPRPGPGRGRARRSRQPQPLRGRLGRHLGRRGVRLAPRGVRNARRHVAGRGRSHRGPLGRPLALRPPRRARRDPDRYRLSGAPVGREQWARQLHHPPVRHGTGVTGLAIRGRPLLSVRAGPPPSQCAHPSGPGSGRRGPAPPAGAVRQRGRHRLLPPGQPPVGRRSSEVGGRLWAARVPPGGKRSGRRGSGRGDGRGPEPFWPGGIPVVLSRRGGRRVGHRRGPGRPGGVGVHPTGRSAGRSTRRRRCPRRSGRSSAGRHGRRHREDPGRGRPGGVRSGGLRPVLRRPHPGRRPRIRAVRDRRGGATVELPPVDPGRWGAGRPGRRQHGDPEARPRNGGGGRRAGPRLVGGRDPDLGAPLRPLRRRRCQRPADHRPPHRRGSAHRGLGDGPPVPAAGAPAWTCTPRRVARTPSS